MTTPVKAGEEDVNSCRAADPLGALSSLCRTVYGHKSQPTHKKHGKKMEILAQKLEQKGETLAQKLEEKRE